MGAPAAERRGRAVSFVWAGRVGHAGDREQPPNPGVQRWAPVGRARGWNGAGGRACDSQLICARIVVLAVPRPRLCRAGAASRPTPRKALPSRPHFLERRVLEVCEGLSWTPSAAPGSSRCRDGGWGLQGSWCLGGPAEPAGCRTRSKPCRRAGVFGVGAGRAGPVESSRGAGG